MLLKLKEWWLLMLVPLMLVSEYLFQFLKVIILAFLQVESKTNIFYVNINFTGNLFFAFGRYCGKVGPEPAVPHSFKALALTKNVLSIGFETIVFYVLFIKMSCFGINLFFKNRELLIITKNADTLLYSSLSWNSSFKFQFEISRQTGKPFCSGNMTTYDFYLICFQFTFKILLTLFL